MSDAGMEENGQAPVPPQQTSPGPGGQLAARRQALGWTIEQVANQLNLAPRQVQAMEDDNYAALPGIVIARGFLRAYAKLLKLDPAPLLALIAEKEAPSPESLELRRTLSATFTESSLPAVKRTGGRGKWLVVALLVVVGAGGWLAWHEGWLNGLQLPAGLTIPAQQVRSTSQGATPDAGSGVPMGQAGEEMPATPAEPEASQHPGQAQVAPPATAPTPIVPPSSSAPAAQASNAAPAQATANAGTAASSSKAAEKLVLTMREASWIELKRADGSAIASRLVPAGSTESFDIESGARLVIGNASGVDVTFRGQAVDLTADAKSNVARLNLK